MPTTRHPPACRLAGLALAAALAGVPVAAQAQVNPFRGYRGPVLSRADIEAGKAATARLLGDDPKPVGAAEAWTGPAPGNSGTLTVERAYRKGGHDCRAIRSRVAYKAGGERNLLFQACRVGGRWRLAD